MQIFYLFGYTCVCMSSVQLSNLHYFYSLKWLCDCDSCRHCPIPYVQLFIRWNLSHGCPGWVGCIPVEDMHSGIVLSLKVKTNFLMVTIQYYIWKTGKYGQCRDTRLIHLRRTTSCHLSRHSCRRSF